MRKNVCTIIVRNVRASFFKRSGNRLKMETNFTRDLCGFPLSPEKQVGIVFKKQILMRAGDRSSCEFFGTFARHSSPPLLSVVGRGNAHFYSKGEHNRESSAAGFVAKKKRSIKCECSKKLKEMESFLFV